MRVTVKKAVPIAYCRLRKTCPAPYISQVPLSLKEIYAPCTCEHIWFVCGWKCSHVIDSEVESLTTVHRMVLTQVMHVEPLNGNTSRTYCKLL